MAPAGRARLVDVATRAGVTVSTASRALGRPELVRPETRARVEAAASELGYVPNRMARGLITGRSATIALVVHDLTIALFALTARSVEASARPRGYDLMIFDMMGDPARETEIVEGTSRYVDGIVVCMPMAAYPRNPNRPPMVTVNRRTRGAHAVLIDQATVADVQLAHLESLGHQRILAVNGPKQYWAAHVRRRHIERLAATHDLVTTAPTDPGFDAGVEVAEHLPPDVTAVMAFTDSQAMGILARCAELGIRVPADLSVVGANDIPVSRMASPALTTVRAPIERIGAATVSLLLDHVDASVGPQIVETFTSELVVRRSSGPPRTERLLKGAS